MQTTRYAMQEAVAVCLFIILNEVFILIIVRDVIWSWDKMNHWHYDSKIKPDIHFQSQ